MENHPTGWAKAAWWDVNEIKGRLKRRLVPKELIKKRNTIIPRPVAYVAWSSLKALKASPQGPAVLAGPPP